MRPTIALARYVVAKLLISGEHPGPSQRPIPTSTGYLLLLIAIKYGGNQITDKQSSLVG